MAADELEWLADQARTRYAIVEIGSWKGRSTKALASTCPGVVYAIDNLVGEDKSPTDKAELALAFYENLAEEIDQAKVRPIRWDSVLAATEFLDRSLDMVFIDGDHEGNGPTNDIAAWFRKLKPGGLLCGHDRFHEGVKKAIDSIPHDDGPGSIWIAHGS